MDTDIRYLQRFENYQRAFALLEEVFIHEPKTLLEQEGMIQRFEYTFELAWKTLQDFFRYRGYEGIIWPRSVIEQAFADGVIQDGELWMSMLKSRNETVHTYDAELVQEILADIRREYFVALQDFAQTFTRITTHDR